MPVLVELVHLPLDAGVLFAGGGELGGGGGDGVRVFAVAVIRHRRRRPAFLLLLRRLLATVLLVVRGVRREDEASERSAIIYVAVLALRWLVWGVQERLKRKREGEEQGEVGKTKGFSSAVLKKYQKRQKQRSLTSSGTTSGLILSLSTMKAGNRDDKGRTGGR
jgi:hypothetical protein